MKKLPTRSSGVVYVDIVVDHKGEFYTARKVKGSTLYHVNSQKVNFIQKKDVSPVKTKICDTHLLDNY
jgi:hypothetical protein